MCITRSSIAWIVVHLLPRLFTPSLPSTALAQSETEQATGAMARALASQAKSLSPAELFRVISASLTQRTSPQQFVMFHLCSVLVISWSFYNCSTISQDKFRGTEEKRKE